MGKQHFNLRVSPGLADALAELAHLRRTTKTELVRELAESLVASHPDSCQIWAEDFRPDPRELPE